MTQQRFNREAKALATKVARGGMSLHEAGWMFRAAVKVAAVKLYGSKSEAARRLNTHRNTFSYTAEWGKRNMLRGM